MLSTMEKVIFLQDIDIFANTETEDLAYIAAIADEIVYPQNTVLFKEGDVSDGMFLLKNRLPPLISRLFHPFLFP